MRAPTMYFVKRQTNSGPNQGRWSVHAPGGGPSIVNGLEMSQAKHIAAAFNLAMLHPEYGEAIRFHQNWELCGPTADGPSIPRRSRR